MMAKPRSKAVSLARSPKLARATEIRREKRLAQNSKWVSIGKAASELSPLPADPHLLSKPSLFDSPLRRDFEQE